MVKKEGAIVEREIADKNLAIVYAPDGGTREIAVPFERRAVACLDDDAIRALVQIGARVEQHYARPMDIEWAYAREKFYMLQARPITTLTNDERRTTHETMPSSLVFGHSPLPGEYNRTMFIEIFPDPLSPIFLSVIALIRHCAAVSRDARFHIRDVGFQTAARYSRHRRFLQSTLFSPRIH
ncbi:MAG: hypothetical protein DCC52_16490 [Chloroflexi bacterium]|nr:MAG: hypothetical protein DCC52_16490 [Chloroflexota bacterium]